MPDWARPLLLALGNHTVGVPGVGVFGWGRFDHLALEVDSDLMTAIRTAAANRST